MLRVAMILFACSLASQVLPQDGGRSLQFVPRMDSGALQLDEMVMLADGTKVTVTQLRFYASQIRFFRRGRMCFVDSASHLIDASEPKSLEIQSGLLRNVQVDSISFLLGIDSLTNVSGAFGGDLDPTKGMYWAWNSGYINWKLEGTCAKCGTAKSGFEFHLGGYLPPFFNAQRIGLPVRTKGTIEITVDVAAFLEQAKLGEHCTIMSPSMAAVELARVAASVFKASGHD